MQQSVQRRYGWLIIENPTCVATLVSLREGWSSPAPRSFWISTTGTANPVTLSVSSEFAIKGGRNAYLDAYCSSRSEWQAFARLCRERELALWIKDGGKVIVASGLKGSRCPKPRWNGSGMNVLIEAPRRCLPNRLSRPGWTRWLGWLVGEDRAIKNVTQAIQTLIFAWLWCCIEGCEERWKGRSGGSTIFTTSSPSRREIDGFKSPAETVMCLAVFFEARMAVVSLHAQLHLFSDFCLCFYLNSESEFGIQIQVKAWITLIRNPNSGITALEMFERSNLFVFPSKEIRI